jgi:hypothetical protein
MSCLIDGMRITTVRNYDTLTTLKIVAGANNVILGY